MVWFPWNDAGLREVMQIKPMYAIGLPLNEWTLGVVFHEPVMYVNTAKTHRWMFWMPDEVPGVFETFQPIELIKWSEDHQRWEYTICD